MACSTDNFPTCSLANLSQPSDTLNEEDASAQPQTADASTSTEELTSAEFVAQATPDERNGALAPVRPTRSAPVEVPVSAQVVALPDDASPRGTKRAHDFDASDEPAPKRVVRAQSAPASTHGSPLRDSAACEAGAGASASGSSASDMHAPFTQAVASIAAEPDHAPASGDAGDSSSLKTVDADDEAIADGETASERASSEPVLCAAPFGLEPL